MGHLEDRPHEARRLGEHLAVALGPAERPLVQNLALGHMGAGLSGRLIDPFHSIGRSATLTSALGYPTLVEVAW